MVKTKDTPDVGVKKLFERCVNWMSAITTDEAYQTFKSGHIDAILNGYESLRPGAHTPFRWNDVRDQQHDFVSSFIHLYQAAITLGQLEFYFRRFPFSKEEVTKSDHARNVCEMYFAQFYIIRNRLKATLNSHNTCKVKPINIGKSLKVFDRCFDQELRHRNSVVHHRPFDDYDLERIGFIGLMATSKYFSDREYKAAYRSFCRLWSQRARRRSEEMMVFLDAMSNIMVKSATFLPETR